LKTNTKFLSTIQKKTLDPNYITGITYGEGNFYISIYEDKRRNNSKQIRFYYKISQRDHSIGMLQNLAEYFQCGTISVDTKENKTLRYVVNNKLDIETKIIPHFLNYPLVTSNFQFLNIYYI
jgi:LAGLIDADG endonuclease